MVGDYQKTFGARLMRVAAMFCAAAVMVSGAVLAGTPASAGATERAATVAQQSAPLAKSGVVKTADLSKFQPGNIISDAVFFNRATMTEAQIQTFLEQRVPRCDAGYTCLKDWYDTSRTTAADAMCGAYSGGVRERASRIIYKVAQACGINPQVILTTLQKEQGLVTHNWPSDWRYTIAMGQGCPDTAACDTRYYGFFNQVYGAAWQLKRYANPPGTSQFFTWYAPGKTWNILYNPNRNCGTSPVYVQNQATANLYYYTPYQPNAAAIRAGYGEGDGCSAYGNRNFFNYFTDWFGSTITGPDPCAQPADAGVAVKAYVVNVPSLNARIAPNTSCGKNAAGLSEGTILQAVAVTADRGWIKVNLESGQRWVAREHLRYATTQESACAIPGGVGPAKHAYVVSAGSTAARSAPSASCVNTSTALASGTVLQAVAVSADRLWVKVNAGASTTWVVRADLRRATTAETPCALPGGVSSAKLHYVIGNSGTTGRAVPNVGCATGAVRLSGGTAVQALRANAARDWLLISTGQGDVWVDRSDLAPSSATATCATVPATRDAKKTYVVLQGGATGRAAPSTACNANAFTVPAGTVVSPTASTSSGDWLFVSLPGGQRWIARSVVREASATEACQSPGDAKVARYTYIVGDAGTTARKAPQSQCSSSAYAVAPGTIATATAVTAAGDWLLLSLPQGSAWVLRSDTTRYIAP